MLDKNNLNKVFASLGPKLKPKVVLVSMDSALTRLEQFALGYGHKITTNYFNNESIKKPKTVWNFKDSDNIVSYLDRFDYIFNELLMNNFFNLRKVRVKS